MDGQVLLRIAAQPSFRLLPLGRCIEKSEAFELFGAELVAGRKDLWAWARSGATRQTTVMGGDRKMVELHLWVKKTWPDFLPTTILQEQGASMPPKALPCNTKVIAGPGAFTDAFHRDAVHIPRRGAVAARQDSQGKVEIAAKREYTPLPRKVRKLVGEELYFSLEPQSLRHRRMDGVDAAEHVVSENGLGLGRERDP